MIDPQILFQQQPFKIETPLEAQTQVQNLSNLGNQGQLQQNAIVAGGQENQQRQMDLDDQKLFRQAFASVGGDINKVLPAAAKLGVSAKTMMGWQNALTQQAQGIATLDKTKQENLEKSNSAITGALADVQKEKDPLKQAARWTEALTSLAGQGSIQSADVIPYPGSPEAVDHYVALHRTTAQLIEQQKADAASTTAGARATVASADVDLKKQQVKQAARANAAVDLANSTDGADYMAKRGELPLNVAQDFPAFSNPDPAAFAAFRQEVLKRALTPDQAVTTSATAARDQSTVDFRKQQLAQGAERIAVSLSHLNIDRQKLANEMGGSDPFGSLDAGGQLIAKQLSTGDFNPGQLGRFKDKEKIMAAGIQLAAARGLNWTPQMYDTKKAFGDPNASGSKNLATIARIAGHVGNYEKNSAALGYNPVFGMGGTVTGKQKATAEDAQAIAAELEKLTSGSVGSISQTQEWQKALRSSFPDVRQKAVDEIAQLVGSQYEAMNQQYRTSVGENLPLDKYVSPVGRAWLKKNNINVTGAAAPGGPGGAAAPPAGTPAPVPTAGGQTINLPAAGAPSAPGGPPPPAKLANAFKMIGYGPGGMQIGSNDNGVTWFDATTGKKYKP